MLVELQLDENLPVKKVVCTRSRSKNLEVPCRSASAALKKHSTDPLGMLLTKVYRTAKN